MSARPPTDTRAPARPVREGDLPLRRGGHALSFPGVLLGIVALSMMQATLLFTYAYLSLQQGGWPPEGVPAPDRLLPGIATAVLLASLAPAIVLHRAARRRAGTAMQAAAVAVALLGLAFVALQAWSYTGLPVAVDEHAYGSVFVVNGVVQHLFALAGAVASLVVLVQVWGSQPAPRLRSGAVGLAAYWYFVVVDWLVVATVLYVSPAFLGGGS